MFETLDMRGNKVGIRKKAEASAEYLGEKLWKKSIKPEREEKQDKEEREHHL